MSDDGEDKKDAAEGGGEEVGAGAAVGVPPKTDMKKRALAALIDGIIAGVAQGVIGVVGGIVGGMTIGLVGGAISCVGGLVAAGYMAVRDSLNDGRSYGKKQMGLVVKTPSGQPCTQQQSIQRNMLLAIPSAVGGVVGLVVHVPVLGLILAPLAALVSLAASLPALYETAQVLFLDKNGRRMMELKSQTYTVEA